VLTLARWTSPAPLSKALSIEEDSNGFKLSPTEQKTTSGALAVITVKHLRQPLTGVRHSASLKITSKEERLKRLSSLQYLVLKLLLAPLRSL
jgi:hypothetical protein